MRRQFDKPQERRDVAVEDDVDAEREVADHDGCDQRSSGQKKSRTENYSVALAGSEGLRASRFIRRSVTPRTRVELRLQVKDHHLALSREVRSTVHAVWCWRVRRAHRFLLTD